MSSVAVSFTVTAPKRTSAESAFLRFTLPQPRISTDTTLSPSFLICPSTVTVWPTARLRQSDVSMHSVPLPYAVPMNGAPPFVAIV